MGIELAILGASAIGGIASARGSKKATEAQVGAANDTIDFQQGIYDQQQQLFDPFYQSGVNALAAYNYEMGLGPMPGYQYQGFQATPGYQFALDQGNQQIQGSAAAQGNVLSGATMQSLQNNGIGMANQEYNNYMNRLSGMAGSGQAAAGQTASAAGNLGMATGQAYGNIGNAQAAGSVAMGNTINNSLGNALSSYGYLNTTNPGMFG